MERGTGERQESKTKDTRHKDEGHKRKKLEMVRVMDDKLNR